MSGVGQSVAQGVRVLWQLDQTESFHAVVYQLVVLRLLHGGVLPRFSASITDAPHCGQAMRGGQHRVRREIDWWFGPSVEVLSLVPTEVFVVCTMFSAGCTGLLRTTFPGSRICRALDRLGSRQLLILKQRIVWIFTFVSDALRWLRG